MECQALELSKRRDSSVNSALLSPLQINCPKKSERFFAVDFDYTQERVPAEAVAIHEFGCYFMIRTIYNMIQRFKPGRPTWKRKYDD